MSVVFPILDAIRPPPRGPSSSPEVQSIIAHGSRFFSWITRPTVPLLLGRVGPMWDELGLRENDERNMAIRARMAQRSKRPIDHFRDFFVDTAIGGSVAALRCGLDFYGPDHVAFATDFPYGPETGMYFLRENIRAMEELQVRAAERDTIYFGTARKLLRRVL